MIEQLKKIKLTDQDLDVLGGIAIVCSHVAEKCLMAAARHFENEYKKKDEYLALCKRYGKAVVDMKIKEQAIKVTRGENRLKLGRTLDTINKALEEISKVTNKSIDPTMCTAKDMCEGYDALMNDVKLYGKIFASISNCDNEDDIVKIESYLKLMSKNWKKERASERVLNIFDTKFI